MSIDEILSQINNPVFVVIAFIFILVIIKVINNIRINQGAKSYIKRANKLRRKKFNGPDLIEYTAMKRRRGSNTYRRLKGNAKSKVDKYFQYKEEELPALVTFSYGKKRRKTRKKLVIYLTNGHHKIIKIKMGKTVKELVNLSNKFECLDEIIRFLHNLPDAILNKKEYSLYIPEHEATLGYEIK